MNSRVLKALEIVVDSFGRDVPAFDHGFAKLRIVG
jgi:hypothetical protein